jgi:hypothetical protein
MQLCSLKQEQEKKKAWLSGSISYPSPNKVYAKPTAINRL